MKAKNKFAVLLMAGITALSSVPAYAAEVYGAARGKPIILQSDITDTIASAEKLGILNENNDITSIVTKKEFSRLMVRFYRAATGATGITLSNSPFVDCDANEVIFCAENGIINGLSNVTFAPENYVTREEACTYLVNAIKFMGLNITDDYMNVKPSFVDFDSVSEEHKNDVAYLSAINVVSGYDGYFYPNSYITYEQAAFMFVEAYYQLMLSKIEINNVEITIGDSEEKALSLFGEPAYKFEDSANGVTVWVYNKNLSRFLYLGIKNGWVTELFSNSSSFVYRGISSGSVVKEVDFGARGELSSTSVSYSDGYGNVRIGWSPGSGKITYIYAYENNNTVNKISKATAANDTKLLYDIINAERTKAGLNAFTVNTDIEQNARTHATNMAYWGYFGYEDSDKLTPFERLDNKKVSYTMASENISKEDNVVKVYCEWMNNSGSRANLLTAEMVDVGMGMAASSNGKNVYTTLDYVKLKNK